MVRLPPLSALAAVVFAASVAACAASTMPAYEQARSAALADPGAVPPNWEPDAVAYLSEPLLADLTATLLEKHGKLDGRFERSALGVTLVLEPDLTVDDLALHEAKRCASCLGVRAVLDGKVGWKLGNERGSVPVTAKIDFDAVFDGRQQDDGTWQVRMQPKDVRGVDLTVGKVQANVAALLESEVAEWARKNLLDDVPEVELGPFGDPNLPVRAMRLEPFGKGLELGFLTTSPTPGTVTGAAPTVDQGFRVVVSTDSLLDLAKRAAFEHGVVGYDVVVEPTTLAFSGDRFDLGIRLWRTSGKGWWRDYTVTGRASVGMAKLNLKPEGVTEGEKSPGAAFVDPLAALGEGYILKTIEEGAAMAVPLAKRGRGGGVAGQARLERITGDATSITLDGTLDMASTGARQRDEGAFGAGHR